MAIRKRMPNASSRTQNIFMVVVGWVQGIERVRNSQEAEEKENPEDRLQLDL